MILSHAVSSICIFVYLDVFFFKSLTYLLSIGM